MLRIMPVRNRVLLLDDSFTMILKVGRYRILGDEELRR